MVEGRDDKGKGESRFVCEGQTGRAPEKSCSSVRRSYPDFAVPVQNAAVASKATLARWAAAIRGLSLVANGKPRRNANSRYVAS